MTYKVAYLLANFGGPRDLEEIEDFLIELLNDQEVIRTSLPAFVHRWLFTRVAKKRAVKIASDYAFIGGKSPIFEDTEELAKKIGELLGQEVITFHRYLPKTHALFLEKLRGCKEVEEIRVLPLFPQFSYATTGSIALWFSRHLDKQTLHKLRWVKSYPAHPSYLAALQACLTDFLRAQQLKEEETFLLCSAHGLPQRFIHTGDVYEAQCRLTFEHLSARFGKALSLLSFQSQFGKEEWIRPYTAEVCQNMRDYSNGRKNIVIVPLSFTSDHIETLYEIEKIYVEAVRGQGICAFRCPALNLREDWVKTLAELFVMEDLVDNVSLLRRRRSLMLLEQTASEERKKEKRS